MKGLIKISLTILLLLWVFQSYYGDKGVNPQIELLKSAGYGFLGMLALYCRDIQICLKLIQPENRKMHPNAAWYMVLLPFGFIEIFFIVINLSNSIEAEASVNPKLVTVKDYGLVSGIGLSIAQVLLFIPNYIGLIAGFFGLVFIVIHWILIKKITTLLA